MRTLRVTERVRVIEHHEHGRTKVRITKSEDQGMKEGGIHWEVPTEAIPEELRAPGTEIVLTQETLVPEGEHEMGEVGKHPPRYRVAASSS